MTLTVLCFSALLIAGPSSPVPDDLEGTFQKLKDAESKKDPALVKKLATEVFARTRKSAATPAPENDEQKELWAKRKEWLRDVELRTEYAVYVTAVQSPPAVTIDLLSTLEQLSPKSKYLDQGYMNYFVALNQTGAASKIPAIAEKALANFPENEDLLLVLTETALNRKQSDRGLSLAERLMAVLARHPKPEGMSAADWERKRSAALARAYWTAGIIHSEKTQYFEANKDLRNALPLVKGNEAMLAAALFHLGVANYQLGSMTRNKAQILEAAKFSEQAAAIAGPLAQQAWRNAQVMKAEAAKMR